MQAGRELGRATSIKPAARRAWPIHDPAPCRTPLRAAAFEASSLYRKNPEKTAGSLNTEAPARAKLTPQGGRG
jgi:hypothetical protein